LETLSRDLERYLGDSTDMRYPDKMKLQRIPNEVYTEERARSAKQMATEILQYVKEKII